MINGIHALIYTKKPDNVRKFFKDILKFPSIDAGKGWLIFALPPAELGVHPTDEDSYHELYFLCRDLKKTIIKLKKKRIKILDPITDREWGLVTRIKLTGGDIFGIYQPKHPTAITLKHKKNILE